MSDSWKMEEGGTYFISFAIVDWIDLFTRRDYAQFVLDNLIFCQKNKGLLLYRFVIMPSHIHLIAGAEKGLVTHVLRDFKTFTSKRLVELIRDHPQESRKEWLLQMFHRHGQRNPMNKDNQLWQNTNHPIALETERSFEQSESYIHENPVVAGLVTTPEAYVWSSANPDIGVVLAEW